MIYIVIALATIIFSATSIATNDDTALIVAIILASLYIIYFVIIRFLKYRRETKNIKLDNKKKKLEIKKLEGENTNSEPKQ